MRTHAAPRCLPPRPLSPQIVGVHMMGLHSADNIHEFSNAMNMGLTLRDLKFNVHAHPTVAEVGPPAARRTGKAARQHSPPLRSPAHAPAPPAPTAPA